MADLQFLEILSYLDFRDCVCKVINLTLKLARGIRTGLSILYCQIAGGGGEYRGDSIQIWVHIMIYLYRHIPVGL